MTDADEPLTPAERRARDLLAQLAGAPVQPGRELTARVVRAARWQRLVRSALQASGGVLSAAADGVTMLFGARRRR